MSVYKNKYIEIIRGDIIGAIVSSIITLPQALAFGVATGLGAIAGIWGSIILCITAGILGGKIPLISGPTGPTAVILASIMTTKGMDIESVMLVIILAGIIQIIIAYTSLPSIVKYVPYPVISGFMNGVGILIIILQLNPLLGFKTLASPIETFINIVKNFGNINNEALYLGLLTLIIVFFIPKKINRYVPSQIIALIICTILSVKFGMNIERIAEINFSVPEIYVPRLEINKILDLIPYALTIGIVCSSESLLTGLVVDSITKTKNESKYLLRGQGIGNILCGLTGSLIGAAATMRSVAAIKSGAATKFVTILNPIILIILMMNFIKYVEQIPLCVLAGILIKIGYDIIDFKLLKVIKYAPRDDLYVLATVFLLTVFYNLIFAVSIGIILASLLYSKRIADKTNIEVKAIYDEEIMKLEKALEKDYKYKIRVVHIEGQFFFGSATQIVSQFDEFLGTRYLILNYESNDLLDISAVFALEDIIVRLQNQKIIVLLVVKNDKIRNQLKELKIFDQIGEENIHYNEYEAVNLAKSCMLKKINRRKFG